MSKTKSLFFPEVSELLKKTFLLDEGTDYWVHTYFRLFEKTPEKCRTFSVIAKNYQGRTICEWYEAKVDGEVYLFMGGRPTKREDNGWAWETENALNMIEKTINSGNVLQELYRERLLKMRDASE
ncbi:hypothetical protein [Brazilian marseillevirus]|uniref:hypothetical protein n=1 Tax=Brazilian marseillevirus TaxID=1813599 RepID=UPI000784422B|nr:hypothetical protein A3303_gp119 [Brazilian marseillevirus]AMQ10627.1 hypothetical protein [Brazilian marseillevirus]